jgi:hypothetical protein
MMKKQRWTGHANYLNEKSVGNEFKNAQKEAHQFSILSCIHDDGLIVILNCFEVILLV